MTVWIPYTDLAPETEAFGRAMGATPVHLVDRNEGYGLMMADLWDIGAGFVIVEQDVAPLQAEVETIMACSQPLCFFGYRGEERACLVFGCVRFSADFIAAHPTLWTDYLAAKDVPEGHPDHDFSAPRCRRWMMLPEWVDHRTGTAAHFHGRVRHLARMAGTR